MSLSRIQVRRAGQIVKEFEFYDDLLTGDASNDIRLEQGDIVFEPLVGPKVTVVGEVRRVAIFETTAGVSLWDLIERADGRLPSVYRPRPISVASTRKTVLSCCSGSPELSIQRIIRWTTRSYKISIRSSPTGSPFVEAFNDSLRRECLPQHWFIDSQDAQRTLEEWTQDYNNVRPHSKSRRCTPGPHRSRWLLHPRPREASIPALLMDQLWGRLLSR